MRSLNRYSSNLFFILILSISIVFLGYIPKIDENNFNETINTNQEFEISDEFYVKSGQLFNLKIETNISLSLSIYFLNIDNSTLVQSIIDNISVGSSIDNITANGIEDFYSMRINNSGILSIYILYAYNGTIENEEIQFGYINTYYTSSVDYNYLLNNLLKYVLILLSSIFLFEIINRSISKNKSTALFIDETRESAELIQVLLERDLSLKKVYRFNAGNKINKNYMGLYITGLLLTLNLHSNIEFGNRFDLHQNITILFVVLYTIMNVSIFSSSLSLSYQDVSHEWTYPLSRKFMLLSNFINSTLDICFTVFPTIIVAGYIRYGIIMNIEVPWSIIILFSLYLTLLSIIILLIYYIILFTIKDRIVSVGLVSLGFILLDRIKTNLVLPTISSFYKIIYLHYIIPILVFITLGIILLIMPLAMHLYDKLTIENFNK
jgi:hypothetical protein